MLIVLFGYSLTEQKLPDASEGLENILSGVDNLRYDV